MGGDELNAMTDGTEWFDGRVSVSLVVDERHDATRFVLSCFLTDIYLDSMELWTSVPGDC